MSASRLLSLLMLLQAHARMSAPALARVLEVSVRTVLRDIDRLSAAGVPVWGERGRNGGFQLRAGWSTRLTGLTEAEAGALAFSGVPAAAADLGLGAAATSARLKVIAGLPGEWREQASLVAERLHIDPHDWYREHESAPFLHDLAQATWQSHRVRVRYQGWNQTRERELEPLGLVLKAGAWYLVARSRGSGRTAMYRLSNVQALAVQRERFRRPADFELARWWAASVARFESELARVQARVRVSPRAMTWLANARIRSVAVDRATRVKESRRGWQQRLVALESIEHGARQLLAFGAEIEVLAPLELRRVLAETAAAVHDRHAARSVGA